MHKKSVEAEAEDRSRRLGTGSFSRNGYEPWVKSPVQLKFNPEDPTIEDVVREVFKDDLARTLWLGIRYRHIVSDRFHQKCLDAANYMKENGLPESPEELRGILMGYIGHLYAGPELTRELFPYVLGKEELRYEIVE